MAIAPMTITTTQGHAVESPLPPMASGRRPVIGHAGEFLLRPIELLFRGYAEHGNVYSIALGSELGVVLLGAEHSRFVLSETDKRFSLGDAYPFIKQMFSPDFYFFGPPSEYSRQRAVILPRFQGKQLDNAVRSMADEIRALTDAMGTAGEIDLTTALGPLVMRIAARTLFGDEFGSHLTDREFRLFRRFSAGLSAIVPLWWPSPARILGLRARDRLYRSVLAMVHERRRHPRDPEDFMQLFVDAHYEDGDRVPDDVLVNMLLFLTWSGHETTTGHLSWALVHLLQHPCELERVMEEQRAAAGSAPLSSLEQVGQLKHLDNALHETERLSPVVFTLLRIATEDVDRDGYRIPKGTCVLLSPWVSHREPSVFPDPDRYWPDRFVQFPQSKSHLIGFGGGVHRCLGQHFAYLEMKLIVSALLANYDLELVDQRPEPVRGPRTKWPASPCRVRYTRRREARAV